MDKLKALLADPVKMESTIKDSWTKIDTKNEGEVPLETFIACCEQIAKEMGITEILPTTEKGKEEFRKISDPNNTGKVNFEGFQKIVQTGIENMKKAQNGSNDSKIIAYMTSSSLSDYMKSALEAANIKPSTTAPSDEAIPNIFIVSGAELSKLTDKDILLVVRTCLEGQTFIIDKPTISDLIGFNQSVNKVLSKEENSYYNNMTNISSYSIRNIFNQFPEAEYGKPEKSKKFFIAIGMRKSQIYYVHDFDEVVELKEVIEEPLEKTNKEITKENIVSSSDINNKTSSEEVNEYFDSTKLTQESARGFGEWLNSTRKAPLQSARDDAQIAQSFEHDFTAIFCANHYDKRYNGRKELVQVFFDIWAVCDIDNKKDYYMVRTSVICNNHQLSFQNELNQKREAGPYFEQCFITARIAPDHSRIKTNDCSPQTSQGSYIYQSGLSFILEGNVGTTKIGPAEGLSNGIKISNSRSQNISDVSIKLECNDKNSAGWTFYSPNVEPFWKSGGAKEYTYNGPKPIQINRAVFDTYSIYTMDSNNYWVEEKVPLESMVQIKTSMLVITSASFRNFQYKFPGNFSSDIFTDYVRKPCNSCCNYIMFLEPPSEVSLEKKKYYNKILKQFFPEWGSDLKCYGFCDTALYSPSSTNGQLDYVATTFFENVKIVINKNKEVLRASGFYGKFKFILRNSELGKNLKFFELTF